MSINDLISLALLLVLVATGATAALLMKDRIWCVGFAAGAVIMQIILILSR